MQSVILCVMGQWRADWLTYFSQLIQEHGGQIGDSRLLRSHDQAIFSVQVMGSWDAIVKLEHALSRVEKHLDVRCFSQRVTQNPASVEHFLPYIVEVTAPLEGEWLAILVRFFYEQGLNIADLHTQQQLSPASQLPLLTLTLTVHVPVQHSLSILRGEFIDLCDALNIDAMLSPLR
jgi:glycine cleavage system transcriptional repressor